MTSESSGAIPSKEDLFYETVPTAVASEEDEEDVCRICRMPAETDNTLFFPCKCSGSIKYVHQQCLLVWLNHSGNTHCEVCKHKFSFTPVYAKDAPTVLPWYQLLFGLLKRGANAVKVAHRIWLVCSIWLVIVPLCTGLAWRLAFAESASEAAQIFVRRFSLLALITDCIQGFLLSITILFLNMGFSSLKDYLRQCVRSLEQQLVNSLAAATEGNDSTQDGTGYDGAAAAEDSNAVAGEDNTPENEAAANNLIGFQDLNDDEPERMHDENQAEIPFEELIGLQGPWLNFVETIALVTIGNAFFMFMAIWVPLNLGRFGIHVWNQSLQSLLEKHASQAETTALAIGTALMNTTATVLNSSTELVVDAASSIANNATEVITGMDGALVQSAAAALPAVASFSAAGELAVNVVQTVAGNLSQIAKAVHDVGGDVVFKALEPVLETVAQPQCGLVQQYINASGHIMEAAAAAVGTGQLGKELVTVAPAPIGAPSNRSAGLHDPSQPYPLQPLVLMVMTIEQMLKELQANLEPPPKSDFAALGVGHMFLLVLAFGFLWGYISVRLWKLRSRRAYIFTQQSMWQVLNTATSWAVGTLAQVVKLFKLGVLLVVELGLLPLATGIWLDLSLLPLMSSTMEQHVASFMHAPLLLAFVHWLLGVAFMLAFTFLVCMAGEVLRPGALPFLKVTNPDHNPIREMMEDPLITHLGRVSLLCLLYAFLCATLVHFPALLARAAMPQLFPLRLYFLDPFTQIPADMLLFHVCVPFTVEHVKVKALVKTVIRYWLRGVGWLLGLQDYLLLPADAAATNGTGEEQQQPQADTQDAPEAEADTQDVPAAEADAQPEPATVNEQQQVQEEQVEEVDTSDIPAAGTQDQGPPSTDVSGGNAEASVHGVAVAASEASKTVAAPNSHVLSSDDVTTNAAEEIETDEPADVTADTTATTNAAGSTSTSDHDGVGDAANTSANTHASEQDEAQEAASSSVPPLSYFEEQPNYPVKLLAMGLIWVASMVLVGAAFFVVPVSIGRFIFSRLHLLLKNDLYSGALGMYTLWGFYTMCKSAVALANFGNMSAALRAGWRWLVIILKCTCLAVLWLGVVATMLGILVELVLLPLHHNPKQAPTLFWYQDWTMGVLGLKLWHLAIMLTPRREGAPAPAENSWQAHFEALQRDGLMNLNFVRALRYIILPVVFHLSVAMAVPYVATRVLLPHVPYMPAKVLDFANLYAYTVAFVLYVAYKAMKQLRNWLRDLHNVIRDDWYLVGRELNNFSEEPEADTSLKLLTAGPQRDGEANTSNGDSIASVSLSGPGVSQPQLDDEDVHFSSPAAVTARLETEVVVPSSIPDPIPSH